MERKIERLLRAAEQIAGQEGGIESLKGAINNTMRLSQEGAPVSQQNLRILEVIFELARRAGKNALLQVQTKQSLVFGISKFDLTPYNV